MPGCLGWMRCGSSAGFYLPWLGEPGRGRALGVGQVKFSGQVMPDAKLVRYEIDIRRVMRGKLALVIADGRPWSTAARSTSPATCAWACSVDGGLLRCSRVRSDVSSSPAWASCRASATMPTTVSRVAARWPRGIRSMPEYAELGLRSQVAGVPQIDLEAQIDRKLKRFMGDAAAYALRGDARRRSPMPACRNEQVRDPRTGVIAGSGGGSAQWQIETGDLLRNRACARSARTWCRARCARPCPRRWRPPSASAA